MCGVSEYTATLYKCGNNLTQRGSLACPIIITIIIINIIRQKPLSKSVTIAHSTSTKLPLTPLCFSFRFVRTPSNLLVLSLSLADLLMMMKVPIFLVNVYKGGPYFGAVGAKVGVTNQPETDVLINSIFKYHIYLISN